MKNRFDNSSPRAFLFPLLLACATQACGAATPMKDAEAPGVSEGPAREAPFDASDVPDAPTVMDTAVADTAAAPADTAGMAMPARASSFSSPALAAQATETEGRVEPAPAAAPPPEPSRAPTAASAPEPDRAVIAEARRMVDIEAHLSIEVSDVRRAARKLRRLVASRGGQITSESITASEQTARAEITLRLPAQGATDFLSALDGIGIVRSRQVNAKDIGKEFYDATIRLANFEAARKRYEDILGQAKSIDEVLRLEAELGRIRQQIEQLKGELRWMRDRAARATVTVSLVTHGDAPPPVILAPEAKLFPGVRASFLRDVRGSVADESYLGAGLIVGIWPQFAFEVQGFRTLDEGAEGLAGVFLTLGGRLYSEFFGNGNRELFNPYLGLRGGYARLGENNEALLGGSVGVELLKTKRVVLDTQLRSYALFGSKAGGHVGVEPTIGVVVAF